MKRQLAAITATILTLTALTACGNTSDTTQAQNQNQQTATAMSKTKAAKAYTEAVEPMNKAQNDFALSIYTFDVNTAKDAATKAADQYDKSAEQIASLEWPENVSESIDTFVQETRKDAKLLRNAAEKDSLEGIVKAFSEHSDAKTSQTIRQKLGLPEAEPVTTPFTVESIEVTPPEDGDRDVTITVRNNLPVNLRDFSVDYSVKDAQGNTITTGSASQNGANAAPGTTVPATSYTSEDIPSGSIVEASGGTIMDLASGTYLPFSFTYDQPTGTVQ